MTTIKAKAVEAPNKTDWIIRFRGLDYIFHPSPKALYMGKDGTETLTLYGAVFNPMSQFLYETEDNKRRLLVIREAQPKTLRQSNPTLKGEACF